MKEEIYRSFSGKLGVENQEGYIIYSVDEWLEYKTLSVRQNTITVRIRFRPSDAPIDWSDMCALGEIIEAVDCGRIPGQVWYRGAWRTPRKLIEQYQDYNWKKYCK